MSIKLQSFLKNIRYVDVAPNEIMSKYQINRNVEKLLQNDELIRSACESVLGSMNVKEYHDGVTYDYGDLVWFLLKIDGKTDSLWMLRCIAERNSTPPDAVLTETRQLDSAKLSESGWKDENKYIDLVSAGVVNAIKQHVNSRLVKHATGHLHRFGRMNASTMSGKVLKCDLSNISSGRSERLFPYETKFMQQDGSVLYGYARRYESGLLEYDVVFRLGYSGKQMVDGVETTTLKCNDAQIYSTASLPEKSQDWTGNERYFQSTGDYSIFKKTYTGQSAIGRVQQVNRCRYVNVYSAVITFLAEQRFQFDGNGYMAFCSDVMSQDRFTDDMSVNPGTNAIIFCNKSGRSITAIYVTTPKAGEYDPSKNGLVSNTYHCKLIGKAYL